MILFLFISASCALSFILVPVGDHWHSTWSDSEATPWMDKEFARSGGFSTMALVFNDHSDLKIRKTPNGYEQYKKDIESLDDARFIAIAGLELSVVKSDDPNPDKLPETLCHMGWIGDRDDPWIYDSRYDWYNIAEVIQIACPSLTDNACIANHLKDCKVWADYQYLSHFSGMELFNDLGLESNYIYHRTVYLAAQAKGWRGYGTAGSDMHNYFAQSFLGSIIMYVCAEQFDKNSIEQAIFQGKIVATNGLKVKELNLCPATITQMIEGNSFEIKGMVEVDQENKVFKNLTVYKDGIYYKNVALKFKRRVTAFNTEYDFDFSDAVFPEDHCYIFEIYRHMITSPFCFAKKAEKSKLLLGKVFRITKVTTSQMFFITEKEGLKTPYPFAAFEYCYKDFALTADGLIFGCKSPFMINGMVNGYDGAVLYYAPEIYKSFPIENVEKSYAIALGKNEYKCVANKNFYCVIIAASKKVNPGDKFYACDPNGPIIYNKEDGSIGCNKTCLGEASFPGISTFWTFHKISGNCPAILSGSIWLVPKGH